MKLFDCGVCGQTLYFGNVRCLRCGHALGYEPRRHRLLALEAEGELWRSAEPGDEAAAEPPRYRSCENQAHGVCNWLLVADEPGRLCRACRHNLTIPDLSVAENLPLWTKIEEAKHRLFYTLLRLGLPLADRSDDPEGGLGFEFLRTVDPSAKVLTGHASGVITLAVAEADDAERERRRSALGEPQRTLLGHFRHEIGHYYWDRLVKDGPSQAAFTALFGDASQDYSQALERHYREGPPERWSERFVSAYASSHPWEDFAETWAHYFHIVDTLDTAHAWGLTLAPRLDHQGLLTARLDFDPHQHVPLSTLAEGWLAVSSALNSFNRSMGLADAYPYVLTAQALEKIGFVHDLVHAAR